MTQELSLNSVISMKRADYIKAFKNKALWKKANAVIFLLDYKLEGKKATIAIPFKKATEMKVEMKRLKKEKLHPMKKTAGAFISLENEGEEGMKAKVELLLGGVNPELLQMKGNALFAHIKTTLEVLIAEGAELEAPDPNEIIDNEHEQEEEAIITTVDAQKANEKSIQTPTSGRKLTPQEITKIKENMVKMQEVLDSFKKSLKME